MCHVGPKIFTVWLFIEKVFPRLDESIEYEYRVCPNLDRMLDIVSFKVV